MLRLADHLRERGVAPLVAAGFLNFSQPTFAEAIQDCVAAGATRVAVQPYLLIDGFYSRRLLPRLLAEARVAHPDLHLTTTAPLGFHPALVSLVSARARASLADAPALPTGLLIMAHGTPFANANAPIEQLARELRSRFASVAVGYLELNDPPIPDCCSRPGSQRREPDRGPPLLPSSGGACRHRPAPAGATAPGAVPGHPLLPGRATRLRPVDRRHHRGPRRRGASRQGSPYSRG